MQTRFLAVVGSPATATGGSGSGQIGGATQRLLISHLAGEMAGRPEGV
ncbi:hypothetical protein X735_28305 [Mesorhizobium sp. L2C085B000]|nr:hypothetical protein X735_28305 [Mesorhizobium sp. L2C085B000]